MAEPMKPHYSIMRQFQLGGCLRPDDERVSSIGLWTDCQTFLLLQVQNCGLIERWECDIWRLLGCQVGWCFILNWEDVARGDLSGSCEIAHALVSDLWHTDRKIKANLLLTTSFLSVGFIFASEFNTVAAATCRTFTSQSQTLLECQRYSTRQGIRANTRGCSQLPWRNLRILLLLLLLLWLPSARLQQPTRRHRVNPIHTNWSYKFNPRLA